MKKFEKVEKTGFFRAKFLLRCTLSLILGVYVKHLIIDKRKFFQLIASLMAYVFEKVAHNVISTYSLSENLIQAIFSNLTVEFQFICAIIAGDSF